MLKNGYAGKVLNEDREFDQRVWYIPHHDVFHPKKQDKIWVVFDYSATCNGESLNKHLLQGKDLTNNLTGARFMCDIKPMFYQIRVK